MRTSIYSGIAAIAEGFVVVAFLAAAALVAVGSAVAPFELN
jgi:hypothetical protein